MLTSMGLVLTQLATGRLGNVLVSISPAYRAHEFATGCAWLASGRFSWDPVQAICMLAELMPPVADSRSAPLCDVELLELRYVLEISGSTEGARIGLTR